MTPEELERMNWLCNRIQEEKEPGVFDKLVAELNDHIEAKHGANPRADQARLPVLPSLANTPDTALTD
jgi:hypothetical protein